MHIHIHAHTHTRTHTIQRFAHTHRDDYYAVYSKENTKVNGMLTILLTNIIITFKNHYIVKLFKAQFCHSITVALISKIVLYYHLKRGMTTN